LKPTSCIIGTAETPYTRHPTNNTTTSQVLADAVFDAVRNAGLNLSDIDGFGVSSFTLEPDHAIDFAWRAGMTQLRWLMQDSNGGASAINLLSHAVRAIEAGEAETIVIASGDRMDAAAFTKLVARYNSATEYHLSPLPMPGPNALFALLTQRQMSEYGLEREDYGRIAVTQRRWASMNPGAVYRAPLSMADYLAAPMVAEPLGRFDCVPPVTGANAIIVTSVGRAKGKRGANILSAQNSFNYDDQDSSGLITGLVEAAPRAFNESGVNPSDADVVGVYDDYPAMVIAQLKDIGIMGNTSISEFIKTKLATQQLAVNTSGGQLSAGQAGSAAGMHGVVEVARQLMVSAGSRQVPGARLGIVTGYGMVAYRYGACANVAILEAKL